jgi:hypothetical protein
VNAQVLRLERDGNAELGVHLSARQAAWLDALHSKVEAAEARGVERLGPKLYVVH